MKFFGLTLSLVLFAGGCVPQRPVHTSNPPTQKSQESTEIPQLSGYALGQPISYENITIYPVESKDKQLLGTEYATLSEAKKNGWVEIVEKPGQEEVAFLRVRNTGPKSLMLLGGELLLGGKQDRIVAKDTIVPPGKEIDVPVYCVEHGRWSPTYDKFTYSDTTVPAKVRERATYGNQQEVWDGVEQYNAKVAAPSGETSVQSGLFRGEVQADISKALPYVRDPLLGNGNAVGMVCLVNGQILTLEMFGNHELFRSHAPALLKGFLAEAATSKGVAQQTHSVDSVAKFVAEAMGGDRRQTAHRAGASEWSANTRSTRGVEMRPADNDKGLLHGTYSATQSN